MGNNKHIVNDKWMFLVLYPLLGLVIVHIGNDNTLLDLIVNYTYYLDVLFSIFSCYLVGLYLKYFYRSIHSGIESQEKKIFRFIALKGIVFPSGAILLLEMIYLALIGVPILKSSIFYLELPLIIAFSCILNLIYLVMYSRVDSKVKFETGEETLKENFAVGLGKRKKVLDSSEIAYFIIIDKLTFVVTFSAEKFLLDLTLKEIILKVPSDSFFQLNRQTLVNRKSVVGFSRTETRRLKVELIPDPDKEIFVAKQNAKLFTDWMKF